MAADDAGDDRQPEAGARLAALAPALGPPEALEDRLVLAARQARAVVAHAQAGAGARAVDADLDRAALRRVDDRVAQEVREHLLELVRVAAHDDFVGVEGDLAAGCDRPGIVD